MLVGVLHFVLKAYFRPVSEGNAVSFFGMVRQFGLPGIIFLCLLARYADIEETLVPLNRISERDVATGLHSTWLSRVTKMSERVLAFDARKRDVVGSCQKEIGRAPTLDDVLTNMIDHYKQAEEAWGRRLHREWGLFRSMWPAAVLLDRRLDSQDPDTLSWLRAFSLLACGCIVACLSSLYLLFFRMLFTGSLEAMHQLNTEILLGDAVLVFHGVLIIIFLYRSVRNMFYYAINSEEAELLKGTSFLQRQSPSLY